MRILALVQGRYGDRIVENVRRRGPEGWTIETFRPPRFLPPIVDDPEEFLPGTLPGADLVLALIEDSKAAQLIPAVARLASATAVIAPIDNSAWIPVGLQNQLQQELAEKGIAAVFPKTFCTLTEETAGYRRAARRYENPLISEFARHFGRPKLRFTVNRSTGIIEQVDVERGAPCGATHFAAERLVGTSVEDAVPKAGLLSHHYPCLASMEKEQIDDRLVDTLMHVSGYLVNEEVEEQLKPYRKPPAYLTAGQRLETPGER